MLMTEKKSFMHGIKAYSIIKIRGMGDNHVLCDKDEKNVETPHIIPVDQFKEKLIEVKTQI